MKSLLDVTVRQILRWPRGAVGLDPGSRTVKCRPRSGETIARPQAVWCPDGGQESGLPRRRGVRPWRETFGHRHFRGGAAEVPRTLGTLSQLVCAGPSMVGGSMSPELGLKVTSTSSKPLLRWASAWLA